MDSHSPRPPPLSPVPSPGPLSHLVSVHHREQDRRQALHAVQAAEPRQVDVDLDLLTPVQRQTRQLSAKPPRFNSFTHFMYKRSSTILVMFLTIMEIISCRLVTQRTQTQ